MKRILISALMLFIFTATFAQKFNWNNNQVIAHRGAWKKNNFPQNSIASLNEAAKLGCYGSEFDVWMTSDQVLVVNHDPEFEGLTIEKVTYQELLTKTMSNGEKIPTLEAYLRAGKKQKGTKLILEIKPSLISKERGIDVTNKCIEMVKKIGVSDWMEYISFDYDYCKRILELLPKAKVAYLKGDISAEQMKADKLTGVDYHYSVYQKDGWIENAHRLGLTVNAWTVNTVPEVQWLLAHRVDYITTNEPEMVFEELKKTPVKTGWKLKWADEFDDAGLPLSKNWSYDVGGKGWGNNELQYYTDADTANAVVKKGNLNINVLKENKENNHYTSARLVTKNKFDFKYGRVEVRAMLPKGRGLWPAIWALPTEWKYGSWPKSGEIDIMEHVGYEPDSVYGTVHTERFNHVIHTQVGKAVKINPYNSYHVYAIEWYEDRMDFFVDDEKYFSFKNTGKGAPEWPFDQNFHLILNVAVGGGWGGKKGVDESIFPATMKVDYVRVYQK
ncbi:glycerophosphodiester phosphodiesterase family protein [Pedobacter endophyticus]|uniref:Family 16 glycosylhydrolase n=1 Tax=Pedobacter endophyticus TaxID=2789740 RepID=A0A7U3Q3R8_9SPHI|nr:glycerophosphodiester phosphodiesterase family protein [Pedobacter endophyticus]QPH38050.1 family 16 glycosylhydrolase [Pedobacter endophyticus]